MKVPVTHYLDSGFDASEVYPGVYVLDGLGAVLADSLGAQNVTATEVDDGSVFLVSDAVLDDARILSDGIVKRRKLLP